MCEKTFLTFDTVPIEKGKIWERKISEWNWKVDKKNILRERMREMESGAHEIGKREMLLVCCKLW